MGRVASFSRERSEAASDAMRAHMNCVREQINVIIIITYTRPNRPKYVSIYVYEYLNRQEPKNA